MKKKFFKSLIFIYTLHLTLLTYNFCFGVSENSGTIGFEFLKLYGGLRAQAMGENYVAVDEGLSAIYYNPAGIAGSKSIEVSAEYMLWLDILTKSNLSFIKPNLWILDGFGFGLDYIDIPYEKRETETDDEYEQRSVRNGVFNFCFAKKIKERISLGLSLKFIFQDFGIGESKYNNTFGFALDLGGIYKILDKTNIGFVIKNLGKEFTSTTEDKMPVVIKIGQATKFLEDRLLFVSDLDYGLVDKTLCLGVGGEYKLTKNFHPRVGYKYNLMNNNLGIINGLNIGFGVKFKNVSFDYVFTPKDDLGTIHFVALGYCF